LSLHDLSLHRALVLLAVLVGLAAAAITAARLLGGGTHTPLPQLAAMAFWAIPLWLLVALLLVLGRAWPLLAVPVLVLGLHGWWLAPSLTGRLAAAGPGMLLRVLSFNALNGTADPAAIASAVRHERVDVLVLIELTPELEVRLDPLVRGGLPSSNLAASGGASGAGIWSNQPLQALPPQPGTTFATPRALLSTPDGGRLTVTAVHPMSPRFGTVRLWRRDLTLVGDAVRGVQGPQVVAGDFNAGRDHIRFRRLLDEGLVDAADVRGRSGWPGFTWPADTRGPALTRIDHVLVTPGMVGVRDVRTLRLPGSDHLAVLAALVVRV
jgi:endonuclease/exonuclease/phosphatase (EEP) superfamily protein YafD